jgi:hypothetical protein
MTIVGKIWLVCEVMYELVRARVFTRTSVQATLRTGAETTRQVQLSLEQQELISTIARLVWILGERLSLGFTCLHRSVAAFRILQRRAVECHMRIAPLSSGSAPLFTAHAWVEIPGGQSLGGRVSDAPIFKPVM